MKANSYPSKIGPIKIIAKMDLLQAWKGFIKSIPMEVEINVDRVWRK
jgi:hypothetical protein